MANGVPPRVPMGWSVRDRLIVLTLAVFLPGALAAGWGLWQTKRSHDEQARSFLLELAHAMASVVDHELGRRMATLQTLAKSPPLQRGDLKEFHRFARDVAEDFERVIVLAEPDGDQVLNTRLPFGSPAPQGSKVFASVRAATNAPEDAVLVSDLYFAPVGKRFSFAVQVPVVQGGKVVHYLNMGTFASTLQKLIEDPRLQPGWNVAILDRQGTVVARRIQPERFVGKPGTPDMLRNMRASRQGTFQAKRLDGVQTITAFAPVGQTGWTAVVSMPETELAAGFRSTVIYASGIAALLLLLGVGAALVAARPIAGSMRRLISEAAAVGKVSIATPGPHSVREARLISAELQRASAEIAAGRENLESRVRSAVAEAERVQQALQHAQKMEALGRLTGGIAHDFNNVLQTISMGIEVVLRSEASATSRSAMEAAKRALKSASTLTRQLMAFGRAQPAGKAVVDLPAQVGKLSDLLRGALRQDIELQLDLDAELWPVHVDEVQLELALLNVALNARDAMPNGGRFLITGRNVALGTMGDPRLPAGEYIRLSLEDSGAGIAPEILPKVFEPFFTTKDRGKGLGLGLAQVYGFAVQSDGNAAIESIRGRGTRVSIWLPRYTGSVTPMVEARRATVPIQAGKRILVVEDDANVLSVLKPALEQLGFRVLSANSVDAALTVLAAETVDIVFSDIVMPGGRSGVDLAEAMAIRYPGTPILMSTGYSDRIDVGAPVLRKPYAIEDLVEKLREILEANGHSA